MKFKVLSVLVVGLTLGVGIVFSKNISTLTYQLRLSSIQDVKQRCLRLGQNYQREKCLQPYFGELTALKSANYAMAEAIKLKDQGAIVPCHIAAHYIGNANLAKNNNDVAKALISCPTDCAQGCIHGVMEKYVSTFPSFVQAIEGMPLLCDSLEGYNNPPLRRQCYHGLGHGIMGHTGISLSEGVNVCQGVRDDFGKWVCEDGAMMEYMIESLPSDPKQLTKALPSICQPILVLNDDRHMSVCMENVATALTFITGNDQEKSKSYCDLIQNKRDANWCKLFVLSTVDVNKQF